MGLWMYICLLYISFTIQPLSVSQLIYTYILHTNPAHVDLLYHHWIWWDQKTEVEALNLNSCFFQNDSGTFSFVLLHLH